MALIPVNFEYLTGLRRPFLVGARLTGSWNAQGLRIGAVVVYDDAAVYRRGRLPGLPRDGAARRQPDRPDVSLGSVRFDTPERPDVWGIPTEINDAASTERTRTFTLRAAGQTERHYLTHCRRLGANKLVHERPAAGDPLRRLGAERAQRRAGPRRAGRGVHRQQW